MGEGEYHETVNVTRTDPITLLVRASESRVCDDLFELTCVMQGQLRSESAFSPYGNATTRNLVHIWDNQFVRTGMDDAQSAVLIVAPSFNASLIGAGPTGAPLQPLFGNVNFKAYNINFENRAVGICVTMTGVNHTAVILIRLP